MKANCRKDKRRGNWELFINSKISGFLQSRLYLSYWDTSAFLQDFTYKFKKNIYVEEAV
jgi:hypothetical protein